MHTGTIDIDSLVGGVDLQATLESGQSYLWRRADGQMYEDADEQGWFWTVVRRDGDTVSLTAGDPVVVRVRQRDGHLEWDASEPAEDAVRSLLRLDDDLHAIRATTPDDELLGRAFDRYWGLRIVEDPPFGALISFICSAQMRVSRIHGMQISLAESFGDTVELDGERYAAFPTPGQLAAASEDELRELGLGYRAPYVKRSAEMVADGEAHPGDARDLSYLDARAALTEFVGVGEKVADCICLFSLGFLQAVPLDTWINKTISEYYPECEQDNYADTSAAIRERLGGEYAGYAQTYVFHHLRNDGE